MDLSELECRPSPSVSETPTARPSSVSIGPMSRALRTSMTLTQADWLGLDGSTSYAEDSPASPSPSPESRQARQMTATSGRRCVELLHSQDPLGSLAKMLLVSSPWHSTTCLLTWKVSATPRGRLLFRLVPSMPRTAETGSGLLPTPSGTSNGGKNHVMGRLDEWGGSSNRWRGTEIGKVRCASFEEWMMGFPTGWTELTPSEMPLSRRSRK